MRAPEQRAAARRSGVVLLVVISLLMLFAIVGISFVIYAEAQASTARIRKEGESLRRPDMDPEELLAYFLGQLIYDTDNPFSALRGHSLARNMYGRPGSYVPFNGTGRVHTGGGNDEYYRVNYTMFGGPPRNPDLAGSPNPNYTYPDINHPFLAVMRGRDGAILARSFDRAAHTQFNGNWNDPSMRERVFRPLPCDHKGFPPPEDPGGDVKNLADSPGYLIPGTSLFANNDSYWIDIGHPVMTAPDGRKFKPLFAPLIIDLDNRLNVNVHGNIRGYQAGGVDPRYGMPLSDQGLGPWEVNPRHVIWARDTADGVPIPGGLPDNSGDHECRRLFIGNLDANWKQTIRGRYDIKYPPGVPPPGRVVGPWGEDWHRLPEKYAIRGPNYAPINGDANFPSMGTRYPGFGAPPTSFCPHAANGNFDGWAQGNACRNHPLLYNFFMPADPYYRTDSTGIHFPVSNMEALLRYGDTGSPALSSDLFYVCPISFGDPQRGGVTRRLCTTHTFDIDSPGVTPYLWNPGGGQTSYRLAAGDLYPRGGPLPFPPAGAAPPPNSEFSPTWQALTSFFGRINLNRDLPRGSMGNAAQENSHLAAPATIAQTGSYPPLSNGKIAPANYPQFQRATQARQEFARELFYCARLATGAADPVSVAPGSPEYDALRWLAQLCVNIVDFIDIDDYLTPFEWKPGEYVFGCELPRIVLNEVYAEAAYDSNQIKINFWVELLNPHYGGDIGAQGYSLIGVEGNAARLQVGNPGPSSNPATDWACYKIVIATPTNSRLRDRTNTRGEPDAGSVKLEVASYAPEPTDPMTMKPPAPAIPVGDGGSRDGTNFVRPGGDTITRARTSNEGYYVLGPKADFPVRDPMNPPAAAVEPTLRVKEQQINGKQSALSYQLQNPDFANLPRHTLLLRRLACPYMPPQEDPAQPNYNPYVTVDYVEEVHTNDGADKDQNGQTRVPTAVNQRYSVGRNQPYAAHRSQQKDQKPAAAIVDMPQQTFFKVNEQGNPQGQNRWPYDWLAFCDRPLVSPMELLQVCGYRPHELTQQFMLGTDPLTGKPLQKFQHRAPWFDESARIFRLFEFFDATSPMQWVPVGGRSTGRMNINTMFDREVFNCLGDRKNNHFYSQADVDKMFETMVKSRTPGAVVVAGQVQQANFGPGDRPFRGLATAHTSAGDPQYPAGIGIHDTLLRGADPNNPDPNQPRLFEPNPLNPDANGHPYVKYEFIKKVFNSFTTRSNVFAVWVTVGFFEVVDDSDPTRPPVLGPEIGKAENRHIRHRMFSIIDRTNLTVAFDPNTRQIMPGRPGPRPFFLPSHSRVPGPGVHTIKVPSSRQSNAAQKTIKGDYEGYAWSIKPGDQLVVDVGQNLEVITVADVRIVSLTEAEIDAVFTKAHAARFAISNAVLGNPGPQPRFEPRNPIFHGLVRFISIIE